MKLCPTCGFGLWSYNHDTLTCKHSHLWTEEALSSAPSMTLKHARPTVPQAPYQAPAPKRSFNQMIPVGCLVLLTVDVITRLLGI